PGDTPQQVARGFLDSMASYQAGQPVAREYLSPSVSERWQPTKVLVYDSTAVPLVEPTPGKVMIDVPEVAEVGANGAWTSATPGDKIKVDLKMTKVRGQWRIGRPPDALVMSIYNFTREYDQYNLYFFDPNFEILVPDPVYLPKRGHLQTLLVSALLRGPSPWLHPAVRSALPEDARLAAPAVSVEGRVATVDLDRKALGLYDPQRRFLLAQLAWTLGQIPDVDKVKVTVDRVPLGVEDVGTSAATSNWSTYDPAVAGAARGAYALSKGKVVIVGPDKLVPVSGALGKAHISARSLAVSIYGERVSGQASDPDEPPSEDWLAAVSADGHSVRIYGSAGKSRVVFSGTDILEPSWDRSGKIWMVDRRGGHAKIVAVDNQDQLQTVGAAGLTGQDVRALKVSRDGARVAVLVERSGQTRLLFGRVHRGDGLTIRGLRQVPVAMASMTDLAWAGLDRVAVIGADHGSSPRPTIVSVDGSQVDPLNAGPDAREVAAAPDQPVLLTGEDGHLHLQGTTYLWSDKGEGTCPAYPG
ncbi:MAG TPA: LpqB family beta-propeller domain-containing protein, partial [Actinopolymorphaceae bacterium]|nr:LpqB family beta-propeller domain-containing protein [Actinopolymorphaceae bacterium]